jgi:hypothetical protein
VTEAAMLPLPRPISRQFAGIGAAVLVIAAALLAGRQSLVANLERACTVDDTPYLELCPVPATAQQRAAELKSEISMNPGNSRAYVHLAVTAAAANDDRLLSEASRLAPSHPAVTARQAARALQNQDLPTALEQLVSMVEHGYNDRAAVVLARLVVSGQGQPLAEYLRPGTHWFRQVLAQMFRTQGPFSTALPLVVIGLDRGVLTPADLMPYVRQLKASGAWGDAYSLWVALHQGTSPIIYNAGFKQPFEEDGFDWEASPQHPISRVGAILGRAADETHGSLLDIRFTGRPFAVPLVRQHLFLGPGHYRIHGAYKTTQLRIEQGLAWTVRCSASPVQAGKSAGLLDTAGAWIPFEFEFSVPPDCGWVATLQLETFAAFEATVGSRGRASFAALALNKLER